MMLKKEMIGQDDCCTLALEERTADVLLEVLDNETDRNVLDGSEVVAISHKSGEFFIEVKADKCYDHMMWKVYKKDESGNLVKVDADWHYGLSNAMDLIQSCLLVEDIEEEDATDISVHYIRLESFQFLKNN